VPERISALTAQPVRQFLSAGSANETVPARSVFTPVFVRGLRGAADLDRDGFVTGTELGNYIQGEVIAYRVGQTPQFGKIRDPRLDQGDLVFALPVTPAPPPGLDPATALTRGIERFKANDYAAAFPLMLRAATGGEVRATFYLGYHYAHGLGVTQDYALAREWYQKSAAAGEASAMNNLGVLYANGRGVPRDDAVAHTWYAKAAAGGNLTAITNIAERLEKGVGRPADPARAIDWFKRAAFRGHEPARQALARLGEKAALQWATADPAEALKTGLDRFHNGQRLTAFDPLLRAAVQEQLKAAVYVGYMYANGVGTPADPEEGRVWYEKGAANGDARAMNNLGALYANGIGVPRDYAAAREWYSKSAAAGDSAAMRNLGRHYEYGRGVPVNLATALEWYRKAAALNDEEAVVAIARLEQTAPPIDFESATELSSGDTMRATLRSANQGSLVITAGRIDYRPAVLDPRSTKSLLAASLFMSLACSELASVRAETPPGGTIALVVDLKNGRTFMFRGSNATRAQTLVNAACRLKEGATSTAPR
jgi:TPR repeat protein